jgi:hypothetical protein
VGGAETSGVHQEFTLVYLRCSHGCVYLMFDERGLEGQLNRVGVGARARVVGSFAPGRYAAERQACAHRAGRRENEWTVVHLVVVPAKTQGYAALFPLFERLDTTLGLTRPQTKQMEFGRRAEPGNLPVFVYELYDCRLVTVTRTFPRHEPQYLLLPPTDETLTLFFDASL